LLSELDEVGPPPYPVLQWEAERKKLDEMRKELETRLYMKFLEKEIQDESSKQGISPPSDASTIAAQVMEDLQVNSEDDFLKSLATNAGFQKLHNKIKRTMNDSSGNMDTHKDHKNKSNQKSGSKATMAHSIPELDEECDEPPPSSSSYLRGADVNKLLENLSGFSDAKSEYSEEPSESESSEEKQESANTTGLDFGVGNISKQSLLKKLGQPKPESSEESESEQSTDETSEESPKPKKQEQKVVFVDPKDKESTKELLEQLGRLKGLKKKQTKEKNPSKVSKKDRRDSSKRPKSVDNEEPQVTTITSKVKKPPTGSLRFRTKPPSLRIKDNSKTRELTKTEKIKDLNNRPKDKLNLSDFGGATNTFEILKMLSMRTQPIEESSESEQSQVLTEELSSDFNPLTCPLIESFGTAEEMNRKGLIRGKKGFNIKVDKSKRYQMEDTNVSAFPFCDCKDLALFCVFDGHAGKDCANELIKIFPKILYQFWSKYNKDRKSTDISQIFTETYREVDEQLKISKFEDEGSTATTIVIWRTPDGKRYFQCANLGDSAAFLYRDGKAISLTQDHKLTVPSERKRIEDTGTVLEPCQHRLNGLAVSRAFGDHFAKSVEPGIISVPHIFKATEILPKDTKIVLASDGLWDVMGGQQAYDIIKTMKDSTKAANKLVKTAVKNSKCNDNVTVTVINLRV
jgi:serine/threonine protein phosphatase PrpC